MAVMDLGDDQDGPGFSPGLSFTVFLLDDSLPLFWCVIANRELHVQVPIFQSKINLALGFLGFPHGENLRT